MPCGTILSCIACNSLRVQQKTSHQAFLQQINRLLFLALLVMVAGFFTWSENVAITRVIKVLSRVGMMLAVIVLYQRILKKGAIASFRWNNTLSPLLYLCYLLLGFVSFLWTTNIGYSALQWIMDVESFVFAFYFIKCMVLLDTYFPAHQIRLHRLLGNVAFSLLLVFIVGMLIAPDTFFRKVEGGEDARLGGYIMNPNELGMLCGVGISCLLLDVYDKQQRVWAILKMAILAYALILTKSRSSLLGLLLIVFFHIRNANNKKLEIAVYLCILAVIPVAIEKLMLRKGGVDDVLSMTGRLPFWTALITEALPQEPLLGFGFMRIYYTETFQGVHTYAGHMTHNTFIQVLMNLGLIGFTLIVFQMVFTIKGFLKAGQQQRLMLTGMLIPILINSFTEFGIFGETNYGILFYQLLLFSISIVHNPLLTPAEKLLLAKRRPDLIHKPVALSV